MDDAFFPGNGFIPDFGLHGSSQCDVQIIVGIANTKTDGQTVLGVIVYQHHPVSGLSKTYSQIDGGSGFSNTSLLIDNGNGFAVVHFVPPSFYFLLHQNTENLSALWSVRFIRPRPLNAQREII